ncbi:hypothetical protein QOZ80_8AG0626770 [Eleusine coracana subsp. coracana]|nr:hypothetical protein QOZ80_8AG0626770 [Eleusine coracana subsp. coracana]
MAAGRPACSDHLRAPSALTNASRSRYLGSSAVSSEPEDANEAVASSVHAVPLAREHESLSSDTGFLLHMRAVAVYASVPAPRGATRMKPMLVAALPLLAVAFLPPPVAALVAFSSLAAPARAWSEEYCSKVTHASCAVYDYDNDTATVDRRRHHPGLNAQCEHPICRAKTHDRAVLHAVQHGRGDDPLLIFCSVLRIVKDPPPSMLSWKNVWMTQVPVADPATAAASGDRICYIEPVHLGYREGYYIRCPNANDQGTHSSCTVFPEQEGAAEIAAALWEHRKLNYCNTQKFLNVKNSILI